MFVQNLRRAAICQWNGIIYAAGWENGSVWFEYSDDRGRTAGEIIQGQTRTRVCDAEEQQPAIEILSTSEIVVAVSQGGEVVTYFSSDQGATWQTAV